MIPKDFLNMLTVECHLCNGSGKAILGDCHICQGSGRELTELGAELWKLFEPRVSYLIHEAIDASR